MRNSAGLWCVGQTWPTSAKYASTSATGPQYATFPPEVSSVRSSSRSKLLERGWCSTATTTARSSTAVSFNLATILSAWCASRPVVGSSANTTPPADETLFENKPLSPSSATVASRETSRTTSEEEELGGGRSDDDFGAPTSTTFLFPILNPSVSHAMANLRRSPPETPRTATPPVSPPTSVSAHAASPSRRSTSSTSLSSPPCSLASSVSVSRTVRLEKNLGSCSTYDTGTRGFFARFERSREKSASPTRGSLESAPSTPRMMPPRFSPRDEPDAWRSSPPCMTSPLSSAPLRSRTRPAKMFRSVVLPLPEGPSIPCRRPGCAIPLVPRKISRLRVVPRRPTA